MAATHNKIQVQPHSYGGSRRPRRTMDYKGYNEANLEMALEAVMSGRMYQTQAAKTFGVPRQTIGSRIDKLNRTK